MRCFIAIEVPEKCRKRILPLLKELREKGVSTVMPENLHLTLKFLGDITPDKVQKTTDALSRIKVEPFKLKLEGIGAFPNENYVRVVWVGMKNKQLDSIAEQVNSALNGIFPVEKFSAHLTIGRVKRKVQNLSSFFEKYKNAYLGSFPVASFELMQSELSKEGPKYSVLWSSQQS